MASQGPNSPGTVSGNAQGVAWVNPNNVKVSDVSYTTVELDQQSSERLLCTNFGFTIPVGATIDGVLLEVQQKSDQTGVIRDHSVTLTKNGTTGSGSDKATATQWPASAAYASYGGSSDLWGTTWTVAQINASTFGALLETDEAGTNVDTAYIDHVRITVYYTAAAGVAMQTYYYRQHVAGGSAV